MPGWPSATATWAWSRTGRPGRWPSSRISAAGRGEVRNVAVEALGTERFDLVCAFEVLEHIEDDAAAREAVGRAAAARRLAAAVRPGATSAGTGRSTSWSATSAATTREAMAALLASCGFGEIESASTASRLATCWRPPAT